MQGPEMKKTDVLVLTVPCDQWSTMQNMANEKIDPEVKRKRMSKAMKMLRFAVKLADEQFKAGRHVIIEHPVGSRMWGEKCMRQFVTRFTCYESRLDQCELGLKFMHQARRKRTRIVTSISDLAKALNANTMQRKAYTPSYFGKGKRDKYLEGISDMDAEDVPIYSETLSEVLL